MSETGDTVPQAAAMEVEAVYLEEGDVCAEEGCEVVPSTKALKDFSLSPDQLFFDFGESVDLPLSVKKVEEDDDGFEKIEISSPFVSAAVAASQRSVTENLGPTFNTSDDARVDFFFHVMEQTGPTVVTDLLEKAWNKDALDTLKLIGSLRDIKDGKGIRYQYHHCLKWLYKYHPLTLYNNLPQLLKLGYWKDALEMLMTIAFRGLIPQFLTADDGNKQRVPNPIRRGRRGRRVPARIKKQRQSDAEKRLYNVKIARHYGMDNAANVAKISKKAMDSARFRFARETFINDTKYRMFHVKIAKIFAAQLAEDLALFNGSDKKKKNDISLASKWAPSLEGHFDRYTLIASTIALELARLQNKDFLTKTSIPTATYLARKFYNKEVCVPLRAHLSIPEREMSAGNWANVNYNRVPARCMQINKAHFIKHDKERLMAYLTKDKSKVAGATLKPIEVIRRAMAMDDSTEEAERIILEKQWISLVEDIKKKGSLMAGAIAICDVSGSMDGDPMMAAMGLTLLTMEQTQAPWNEICVTFSEDPTLFHLKPEMTLLQKVAALHDMDWGGTTNFQATLELILQLGVQNNLPQEDMPKILFVFTDMEFNSAFPGTTATNFEFAKNQFEQKGYKLPTIVFWNLRADTRSKSTPVQKDENGVILLSGFSAQLLSFVMNSKDLETCTPWNFVSKVIAADKYSTLQVYD